MEANEGGHGLLGSLRRLRKAVRDILENRLELLLVELQEARWRFIFGLILTGLMLLLALMTLMVPTIAIVVVCLMEKRADGIVALMLLYLAGTVGCFLYLRAWLRNWTPFSATVSELRKDKECLDEEN